MQNSHFLSPDDIRGRFSQAMSYMYQQEVPLYGDLTRLVAQVNAARLDAEPALRAQLERHGELARLDVERHGAIRVGTAAELSTLRRIFAVMGMQPVGYYDLSVAGVPVHATAFRPVAEASLARNPFRLFTSLLRLELITDPGLRERARGILARRNIFTPRALALTEQCERDGGLTDAEADEFVAEVRETFRWHREATVDAGTYLQLREAHRLVADVVCFKGPHINHLTPRTLDIDAAQAEMLRRGLPAKDVIEGPPRRRHPILLRQTSFKALEEAILYAGEAATGTHTARFGEIEQRGAALTRQGRARYDALLARARDAGDAAAGYARQLEQSFADFPDDLDHLRREGLAFFRYHAPDIAAARRAQGEAPFDLEALLAAGVVHATPITYEDFLPVSAAGIFQSNLGGAEQKPYAAQAAQAAFEQALGAPVLDEIALYEHMQRQSLAALEDALSPALQAG